MAESINPTTAQHSGSLESVLDSLLTDITALRTATNAAIVKMNTLTVKLNSDGGVSDADYATNFATDGALVTTT